MNLTREILIKNGVHPSLITKNSEQKFVGFCLSANKSDDFIAFADSYEQLLLSTANDTLELRQQGAIILKEILKIIEAISEPINNSLLSAFSPITESMKVKFLRAVVLLEAPISSLKRLITQCTVRDDQKPQEMQTELTLRLVALKEYSQDSAVILRYSKLTKDVTAESSRLTELRDETAELLEKAISTVSNLTASGDTALSDTKRPQAEFFALLQKYQLALHNIHRQL